MPQASGSGASPVPVKDRYRQQGDEKLINSSQVENSKNAASESALRRVWKKADRALRAANV
jgi:hypothetical protein